LSGAAAAGANPLTDLAAVPDADSDAAARVVQPDACVAPASAGLDTLVGEWGLRRQGGSVVNGAAARAGGGAATMPVNGRAPSHD